MPKCWNAGKLLTIHSTPGNAWYWMLTVFTFLTKDSEKRQFGIANIVETKKRNLNLNFKRKATAFVVGLWTDLNFHFQFRQNWFQGCSKLSVKNIGSKKLCVLMVYCVLSIMQFNYIRAYFALYPGPGGTSSLE